MKKYNGLKKRIQQVSNRMGFDITYSPDLLIPEEKNGTWIIEGVVFDTKKEALDLAEAIKKDGFMAVLDKIAEDTTSWDEFLTEEE